MDHIDILYVSASCLYIYKTYQYAMCKPFLTFESIRSNENIEPCRRQNVGSVVTKHEESSCQEIKHGVNINAFGNQIEIYIRFSCG